MRGAKDVLIADDDAALRALICAALEKIGLSCDAVVDGVEAVEHLKGNDYAVLLLDLAMPRLDGPGVLKTVGAWKTFQLAASVVLALAAIPARQALPVLEENVQAVIRKPFDVQELAELVHGCVTLRRAHG
jgi:CheY-like chemotaxis protein